MRKQVVVTARRSKTYDVIRPKPNERSRRIRSRSNVIYHRFYTPSPAAPVVIAIIRRQQGDRVEPTRPKTACAFEFDPKQVGFKDENSRLFFDIGFFTFFLFFYLYDVMDWYV